MNPSEASLRIPSRRIPLRSPQEGEPIGDGYIYLGSMSYIGNTVSLPAGGHFGFRWARTDDIDSQWANKSRICDSGGSAIYG